MQKISQGIIHKLPIDLKREIVDYSTLLDKWNYLTPLARNEWICWVISVKKVETRELHIK